MTDSIVYNAMPLRSLSVGEDMLTKLQIESYRNDGYLVVENVLSTDEIDGLRQVTDLLLHESRNLLGHSDVFDIGPEHSPTSPRVRRIKHPNVVDPVYDGVLRHSVILGIVEQLVGASGIRYQETKLNVKAARSGEPVEWHQDWAFVPHTNDDLLAVGIPLDDMTTENGCLRVVPGTHLGDIFNHHADGLFVGAVDPKPIRDLLEAAVPIEVEAGGISIHHVRALHGSARNPSDRSRRLYLLEMGAADAWPLLGVDDFDEFNGRIVSGQPTIEPRVERVPVRIPLPRRPAGSIYELQEDVAASAFD